MKSKHFEIMIPFWLIIAVFLWALAGIFTAVLGQTTLASFQYKKDTLDSWQEVQFNDNGTRDTVQRYYVVEAAAGIAPMGPQYAPQRWKNATYAQKMEWCQDQVDIVLSRIQDSISKRAYNYLAKYAKYAIYEYNRSLFENDCDRWVLASGTLAQALQETGFGRSSLCTTHNNHFGVKCHGWRGKKAWYKDDCHDQVILPNGKVKKRRVACCFRAYKNDYESYKDHTDFILRTSRYKKVWTAKTGEDYARSIGSSGYASSKRYGQDLRVQIGACHLNAFDIRYDQSYMKGISDPVRNQFTTKIANQ